MEMGVVTGALEEYPFTLVVVIVGFLLIPYLYDLYLQVGHVLHTLSCRFSSVSVSSVVE